jgi:hypothetical protein
MPVACAPEAIRPLRWGQLTYYFPADIKRRSVQRFLDALAPTEPLHFPDLSLTAEESVHMDALLDEKRVIGQISESSCQR